MGFDSGGAMGGAASGAMAGAAFGPWGALAGAGIGMAMGGLSGNKKAPGYSKGDLEYFHARRQAEIESFKNELAGLRTQYRSQLASFGTNTFNRFMPNAAAFAAAQGKQVSGGAFGSVLARKAAEIQDEGMLRELDYGRQDAQAVDSARGQLAAAQLSGGFGNMQGLPPPNPMHNLMGQAGSAGFRSLLARRDPKNYTIGDMRGAGRELPATSWQGTLT